MTVDQAKKALKKIKFSPGEAFRRRSPEDQKTIREALLVLARAGKVYAPDKGEPAEKPDKEG